MGLLLRLPSSHAVPFSWPAILMRPAACRRSQHALDLWSDDRRHGTPSGMRWTAITCNTLKIPCRDNCMPLRTGIQLRSFSESVHAEAEGRDGQTLLELWKIARNGPVGGNRHRVLRCLRRGNGRTRRDRSNEEDIRAGATTKAHRRQGARPGKIESGDPRSLHAIFASHAP